MLSGGNGEKAQLPAIAVGWDAEAQGIQLQFDPGQFKTWEFVLAVLEMAVRHAETQHRLGSLQKAQLLQAQALQEEAIRRQLRGER
jgi:hypothetical protein